MSKRYMKKKWRVIIIVLITLVLCGVAAYIAGQSSHAYRGTFVQVNGGECYIGYLREAC